MLRSLAVVFLLVVLGFAAGCSGDEVGRADSEAVASGGDELLATDSGDPDDPEDPDDSDSDGASTGEDEGDSSGTETDSDLPGTHFDNGPQAGEQLDVVSIRHDDVLNFRTWPEASAPLVDTAVPQDPSPAVVSSGEGRLLDSGSVWWKVTVDGQEAWANYAYLGMLGRNDNVLDELIDSLSSTDGQTVEDLVAAIAASRANELTPRVTYVTPIVGVRASDRVLTVDVVGLVDDAYKGERFELRFEPIDDGFRLIEAERTLICGRGVTSDGQCQS